MCEYTHTGMCVNTHNTPVSTDLFSSWCKFVEKVHRVQDELIENVHGSLGLQCIDLSDSDWKGQHKNGERLQGVEDGVTFRRLKQVKNEHSLPARGKSFHNIIVKSRVDMLVLIRNKTKCHAWLLSNTYPRVVNALSNNGQAVFVHFVSSSCHVTGNFYLEFLE